MSTRASSVATADLTADRARFRQFMRLALSTRRHDGEVVLAVRDTGPGVAAEDQPKLFARFKQVGDTLTAKPQGTGLGLPICKEIVEHHGGRIWVESTVGVGNTSSVGLPRLMAAPAPEGPASTGDARMPLLDLDRSLAAPRADGPPASLSSTTTSRCVSCCARSWRVSATRFTRPPKAERRFVWPRR